MTTLNGVSRRALVALGCSILFLACPAAAQGPRPATALGRLEPGLWQLRDLDSAAAPPRSICIADPNLLIQIQHRGSPCSRLILSNAAEAVTVHYTCPANGFGRTSLRVETPRLAKIDTQGISDATPFSYRFEARRTGSCTADRRLSGR